MKKSKAKRFWRNFFKLPEVVVPIASVAVMVIGGLEWGEDQGQWIAPLGLVILGLYTLMTWIDPA